MVKSQVEKCHRLRTIPHQQRRESADLAHQAPRLTVLEAMCNAALSG